MEPKNKTQGFTVDYLEFVDGRSGQHKSLWERSYYGKNALVITDENGKKPQAIFVTNKGNKHALIPVKVGYYLILVVFKEQDKRYNITIHRVTGVEDDHPQTKTSCVFAWGNWEKIRENNWAQITCLQQISSALHSAIIAAITKIWVKNIEYKHGEKKVDYTKMIVPNVDVSTELEDVEPGPLYATLPKKRSKRDIRKYYKKTGYEKMWLNEGKNYLPKTREQDVGT